MTSSEFESCVQELEKVTEKTTRSFRDLLDRAFEADQLLQKLTLLHAASTPQEGYAEITKLANSLFPADAGALCLHSTPSPQVNLEVVAIWPASTRKQVSFAPNECWALRTGKPHVVDAVSPGPFCNHVHPLSCSSYLCVPMMARGEALGVLHLRIVSSGRNQSKADRIRFPEAKRRLAIAMADQVALAIANLRVREMLSQQATHDTLTGLGNRRSFDDALSREVRRALRGLNRTSGERSPEAKPVGVIMFDLDHFNRINRDYTHLGGDALLRSLGKFLREDFCRRGGDVAFRWAGEEFVVILPGASLANARLRAEVLRKQVSRLRVRHADRTLRPVTVSIGVVALPDHGVTPEALISAADTALMRAKNNGRNRVEVARAKGPLVRH